MVGHGPVGGAGLERATRFYDGVMGGIGFAGLETAAETVGYGKTYPEFWVNLRAGMSPVGPGSGAHVALRVRTPGLVDAFHAAALAAGGASDGAPDLRPQHGEGYYAAFVRDLDGNRIEAVTFVTSKA